MIFVVIAMAVLVAGLGFVKFQQIRTAMAQGGWQPPPEAVTTIAASQEQWPAVSSVIGTVAAVQGVTVSADLPVSSAGSPSNPAGWSTWARCW